MGRMSRRGIGAVAVGAVLLTAAVVGFIVVPEHAPGLSSDLSCAGWSPAPPRCHTGWSQTAYDVARIATWALAILGALLVAMGLIRYARPEAQR